MCRACPFQQADLLTVALAKSCYIWVWILVDFAIFNQCATSSDILCRTIAWSRHLAVSAPFARKLALGIVENLIVGILFADELTGVASEDLRSFSFVDDSGRRYEKDWESAENEDCWNETIR